MSRSGVSKPIQSISLSRAQIAELLDSLEFHSGSYDPASRDTRREHERIPCRKSAVLFELVGMPETMAFAAPVRNISCGGLCFLHRSMLHVDTPLRMCLLLDNGASFRTAGTVVRARHVMGLIHEVGVKFNKPIDLSQLDPPQ